VSWEAYAYLLLAAVLVSGFVWFERSQPSARLVALVAALAALAVAGRLVLAPIPNVVATTDIVLITGLALGAAPGFAVGALAALISNLWLGQGPWTPWEMAGWGMVGVGGAAVGAVACERIGRVGLAVVCGLAGLAYGALLDLSVMVSYGGEQSIDRYLAISARGIPFNLAHAAGNVVFALAAGPALVRMIARYRERFEFRWREAGAAPLAVLVAVSALVAIAPERADARPSAAVGWLERAQNSDGGFGVSPGSSSSPTMTGWAVLGLEAAGRSPFTVRNGGPTPISYLRRRISHVRSTGDLERTILALEAAGVNSRQVKARDLPAELRRHRASGGSYGAQVNLTAFAILALRASGSPSAVVRRSARWLRGAQNRDGGWGFQSSAPSDADSTGAALQGLAATGGSDHAMRRGVRYLRRNQERDGGFALGGGGPSNSQSTAWAIQGLIAAGARPARVREHGHSPFDFLSRHQRGDGHYAYSSSSDQTPVWVTGQALVAARHGAFPLRPVPRPQRRQSSSSGGGPGGTTTATSSPSSTGSVPSATPAPAGGGSAQGAGPTSAARQGDGSAHKGGAAPGRAGPGSAPAEDGDTTSAVPLSAPADPGAATPSDGGSHTAVWVLGGLGALALALAAGFVWYRRRLP
jgi:energy-coupling factor transport system substrate-specific component